MFPTGHSHYMETYLSPVDFAIPNEKVVDFSFSETTMLAVTQSGKVYGRVANSIANKPYGQLFTPDDEEQGLHVFSLDSPIVQASAGKEHALFLTADKRVWSLGLDAACLGREGEEALAEITDFREEEVNVVSIGCGDGHNVALTDDGDVISWGKGKDGRLGHGTNTDMAHPSSLEFFEELAATQIGVGNNYGMALSEDGRLFAWGKNEQGQLGQGGGLLMDMYNLEALPVEIDFDDKKLVKIDCGYHTAGAIDEEGVAYFWGVKDSLSPLPVDLANPGEKAVDISVGTRFALILSDAGTLYSVGRGKQGALGLGNTNTEKVAQPVFFFDSLKVKSLACGPEQSAAVTE